jgi:hypothetical protein
MAAGNAKALRALVVVTLVSFLMQGVAGRFDCCFCNCYNACKRIPGRTKDHCHCPLALLQESRLQLQLQGRLCEALLQR